jgi:hypothetical protein
LIFLRGDRGCRLELPQKMTIKIDLSNRPKITAQRSPGFDFPTKCFDMSIRIQRALEALTGAEPWENRSLDSLPRVFALKALHQRLADARKLLNPDKSPEYDLALRCILGEEDYLAGKQARRKDELWPEYGTWLEQEILPERLGGVDLTKLDLARLRVDVYQFTQKIENVGLYFWRMMQAVNGELLPNEIEIKVGPSEAGSSDPTQKGWLMSRNLPNLTR